MILAIELNLSFELKISSSMNQWSLMESHEIAFFLAMFVAHYLLIGFSNWECIEIILIFFLMCLVARFEFVLQHVTLY